MKARRVWQERAGSLPGRGKESIEGKALLRHPLSLHFWDTSLKFLRVVIGSRRAGTRLEDVRRSQKRAKQGQTERFLVEEPGSFWHPLHRGLPCSHDRRRHTASCYAHAAALNWQRSTFRTKASSNVPPVPGFPPRCLLDRRDQPFPSSTVLAGASETGESRSLAT
jgi:hypothetical protein